MFENGLNNILIEDPLGLSDKKKVPRTSDLSSAF